MVKKRRGKNKNPCFIENAKVLFGIVEHSDVYWLQLTMWF